MPRTSWLLSKLHPSIVNAGITLCNTRFKGERLLAIVPSSTVGFLSDLISLSLDSHGQPVPFIIFGDFNFRLDACRLVEVRDQALGEHWLIEEFLFPVVFCRPTNRSDREDQRKGQWRDRENHHSKWRSATEINHRKERIQSTWRTRLLLQHQHRTGTN